MRRADRPSQAYCDALYQLIREAVASMHHDKYQRMHKEGIASRVQGKIHQLQERREWGYGSAPSDLTIYRRIEEMAETGKDWVINMEKGSGWYTMNPDLLTP